MREEGQNGGWKEKKKKKKKNQGLELEAFFFVNRERNIFTIYWGWGGIVLKTLYISM